MLMHTLHITNTANSLCMQVLICDQLKISQMFLSVKIEILWCENHANSLWKELH